MDINRKIYFYRKMFYLIKILYLVFRYWYMGHTSIQLRNCVSHYYSLENVGEKMTDKGVILSNVAVSSSSPKKKFILFLSGLLTCANEIYIRKTVHDMYLKRPNVEDEYFVCVYENHKRTSLEVASHIIAFIEHYNRNIIPIEELNVVGFSAGGILASHVAANLDAHAFRHCIKRVITYDTPMSIIHIMRNFHQNRIYKFDVLYYYFIILVTYRNHVDNRRIRTIVKDGTFFPKYRGVDSTMKQLEQIHGFTSQQLIEKSQFTYRQLDRAEIYHIYCKDDPVVDHTYNIRYRRENIYNIYENKPKIHIIEKDGIDHCCDMWTNTNYVDDILRIVGIE